MAARPLTGATFCSGIGAPEIARPPFPIVTEPLPNERLAAVTDANAAS